MSSYCHICGNFVNNLDDCELPYGGAPAPDYQRAAPGYERSVPGYDGEPSDRSAPDYDEYYDYVRWPARRPWYQIPPPSQENLDVLENPYYVPPLLPEKFEIFLRECSPARSTRSNTDSLRKRKLNQNISPLFDEILHVKGIENKLAVVDQIYAFLKDNMDIVKKNIKLFDVSKQKLDEFIQEFPEEAGYLKTLRVQMFQQ